MVSVTALAQLPFQAAAEAWLETRRPYLAPKTIHEYTLNIRTLSAFFGEMRLPEITADQIRAYQSMRMKQCGPFSINHETSTLQQLLKRIGVWSKIAADYQPLALPKGNRGRALSNAERNQLLSAAALNRDWEAALYFALISVNTSCGPKETATLRLKDLDLEQRFLTVQPEGAKNAYRIRSIPLNDQAFAAVEMALFRAKKLGSSAPDHYFFPFRIHRGLYDPTRYQTTFKTAWKRMLEASGLPRFRMYDLRHTAITTLLENPNVSEETAESIAGHIGQQMKKRYSHVRMEAKRVALNLMNCGPSTASFLRNEDVLAMLQAGLPSEIVIAKIRSSATKFDTSVETLKKLADSGTPSDVVLAMVIGGRQ